MVKLPVVAPAVIDSVEEPEPLTEGGLNVEVASPGKPLTVKLTVSLKPPKAETLTV
jgi:hypothetical protein